MKNLKTIEEFLFQAQCIYLCEDVGGGGVKQGINICKKQKSKRVKVILGCMGGGWKG